MTSRSDDQTDYIRQFPRMQAGDVTQNLETALRPIILTAIQCAMQMTLPARPLVLADAVGGPHQSLDRQVVIQTETMTDQDIVDVTLLHDYVTATTDLVNCDIVSLAGDIADAVVRGMSQLQMIRGNARLQLQLFSGAIQGAADLASFEVSTHPATLAHLLRAKANGTGTEPGDAILFEAAAVLLDRTRIVRTGSLDADK